MKNEMYENANRQDLFKKDDSLEDSIKDINSIIGDLGIDQLRIPQKPIVLIMGVARSGSTFLMQYLASSGAFSYPSNLIARFYKNPYLGIRIQQALLEFDPINQLDFNLENKDLYSSILGKTKGALAPSEYWYYWREFFNFGELNYLEQNELEKVDGNLFIKKLSSFEYLSSKPLVMKGMMLNWNIPYLYSIYNNFIFVNLKRDIESNALSLLNARRKYFDDTNKWYSFKPKEFKVLKNKSAIEQVVGQVFYTQKSIQEGLETIPITNKIELDYEDFCSEPINFINELENKFSNLGTSIEIPRFPIESIVKKSPPNLSSEDQEAIRKAVQHYV